MRQMSLFDGDRRPPSTAEMLREIRMIWLIVLSDGQPHEFGEGQRREQFPPTIAKAVGPLVASLHREGIIEPVGAVRATRPTRNSSIALQWRGPNPERCRELAEADKRWLKSRRGTDKKDAGESAATDSPALNPNTHPTFTGEANNGKAV